jgi:acyl carrier protein
MSPVEDSITRFIAGEILRDTSADALSAECALVESGTLDSLALQQLVMFIEKEYSIHIGDEYLTPENFESTRAIASFVNRILQSGSGGHG